MRLSAESPITTPEPMLPTTRLSAIRCHGHPNTYKSHWDSSQGRSVDEKALAVAPGCAGIELLYVEDLTHHVLKGDEEDLEVVTSEGVCTSQDGPVFAQHAQHAIRSVEGRASDGDGGQLVSSVNSKR